MTAVPRGMTAAAVAVPPGFDALVLETTGFVGGTTPVSGGMARVPGNPKAAAIGQPDSIDPAHAHLVRLVLGTRNEASSRHEFGRAVRIAGRPCCGGVGWAPSGPSPWRSAGGGGRAIWPRRPTCAGWCARSASIPTRWPPPTGKRGCSGGREAAGNDINSVMNGADLRVPRGAEPGERRAGR